MVLAIFGITNDALNLAANLVVLFGVVFWLALIAYTFFDAKRRIEDPVLIICATVASLFPFVGTAIYVILRPPDFLDDVRERELEIKASELRVRQLIEQSCENCGHPIEGDYLRCPSCQRRLKDPCVSCGKPVDPRWALCPFCETPVPGRAEPAAPKQSRGERGRPKAREGRPQDGPPPSPRTKTPQRKGSDGKRDERALSSSSGVRSSGSEGRSGRSDDNKTSEREPRRSDQRNESRPVQGSAKTSRPGLESRDDEAQ